MKRTGWILSVGLCFTFVAGAAQAQQYYPRGGPGCAAPPVYQPGCPTPGAPGPFPGVPGTYTGVPGTYTGVPGTYTGTPGTMTGTPGTMTGTPGTMTGTPGTMTGTPGTMTGQPNFGSGPTGPGESFAQAGEGGTQGAGQLDPGMFGDLIGVVGRRLVPVQTLGATGTPLPPGVRVVRYDGNLAYVVAPLPLRSAFKITENESPRPVDRVYFAYNFFESVDRLLVGVPQTDMHREIIGFEKTFLDGNASFGFRLPFFQMTGNSLTEDTFIGDLNLLLKYALYLDKRTGDVFSTGMVITFPTGPALQIDGQSALHPWVFQPWLGFVKYASQDLYFQGFSSLAVPTDARDVIIWFNSIGAGYWAYRNNECGAGLRGIVPQAEFHVNTPLNHRGIASQPIGFSDSVNFTIGSYFVFNRATAGIAFCTPLTGPKPYDFEIGANLNFRY